MCVCVCEECSACIFVCETSVRERKENQTKNAFEHRTMHSGIRSSPANSGNISNSSVSQCQCWLGCSDHQPPRCGFAFVVVVCKLLVVRYNVLRVRASLRVFVVNIF